MFDEIIFEGITYPIRYISLDIEEFSDKTLVIATENLEKKLFAGDFTNYISDEAKHIDEHIFFYCQENLIYKDEAIINSEIGKCLL
jgi:hypothetical protein